MVSVWLRDLATTPAVLVWQETGLAIDIDHKRRLQIRTEDIITLNFLNKLRNEREQRRP